MPRRATLRSSRDFRRVYRAGTRARRDGVTIWALRCGPPAPTRVGLALRARGLTAVSRNRLRRRIRAIVRDYRAAAGFEVVVGTDVEAAGRTFQELQRDVADALAAAGVARG